MSNESGNRLSGLIRKCLLAILWGACFLALSPYAWNQETSQWKLRVAIENAALCQKPDLASPIVATVPKGTILNSYEVEGAWFRVTITPGKEGAAIIGYIATKRRGDIIYHVSPRFGIGLGMDYVYAIAEGLFVFQGHDAIAFKLWSTSWINAFSIKLGLFSSPKRRLASQRLHPGKPGNQAPIPPMNKVSIPGFWVVS